MTHGDVNSGDWQEIAKKAAEEPDPLKVLQLARELIRALDAQSSERMQQVSAEGKINEKNTA